MLASRRACDRCYAVKARCTFKADTKACDRCQRLRHSCEEKRPVRRPGPRTSHSNQPLEESVEPNSQLCKSESPTSPNHVTTVPASLDDFVLCLRGFNPLEVRLLEYMLDKTAFIGRYVEGNFFQEHFRGMLIRQLVVFPDLLKDVYLACVGGIQQALNYGTATEDRSKTIQRSSRALGTLASMRTTTVQELSAMLTLALGLITISDQIAGLSTMPITQAALRSTGKWMQKSKYRNEIVNDANLVCIVFHETVDCLFRREVPSLRFDNAECEIVSDRYFGICSSMLPILYDLCQLGWSAKQILKGDHGVSPQQELAGLVVDFEGLWHQVEQWKPRLDTWVLPNLAASQIDFMQVQAMCFKTVAKLLILEHIRLVRKASPFTVHAPLVADRRVLARELILLLQEVKGCNGRQFICFPFFIATLVLGEITGDASSHEDHIEEAQIHRSNLRMTLRSYSNGTSESSCAKMTEFADFVWKTQDRQGGNITWLELVEQYPAFSMGL